MHASLMKAQQYRDREAGRRMVNLHRHRGHGLMALYGLKPGVTPKNPEGSHRERRIASHEERYERRYLRFFRGWVALFND